MKYRSGIGLSLSLLVVVVLFQQCGPAEVKKSADSSSGGQNFRPIDYFTETRPAVICGQQGYAFLMRNYITKNCGSCHSGTLNLPNVDMPLFTSTDINVAYDAALGITRERWIVTTTKNQFCGEGCSITPNGEVYNGLVEWLDNRFACP